MGLPVPKVASDVACTLDWAGTVVVAAGRLAAAVDDASVVAVVAAAGTESHPFCMTAYQHVAEVASAADTLLGLPWGNDSYAPVRYYYCPIGSPDWAKRGCCYYYCSVVQEPVTWTD